MSSLSAKLALIKSFTIKLGISHQINGVPIIEPTSNQQLQCKGYHFGTVRLGGGAKSVDITTMKLTTRDFKWSHHADFQLVMPLPAMTWEIGIGGGGWVSALG